MVRNHTGDTMTVSLTETDGGSPTFTLKYNGVPAFSFAFQYVKIDGGEVTFVNDGSSLVIEDCRAYPEVYEVCKGLTEATVDERVPAVEELLVE